jgi:hypothetical protein
MAKESEESIETFHTPLGDVKDTVLPRTAENTSNTLTKPKEKTVTGLGIIFLNTSTDVVSSESKAKGSGKDTRHSEKNYASSTSKASGDAIAAEHSDQAELKEPAQVKVPPPSKDNANTTTFSTDVLTIEPKKMSQVALSISDQTALANEDALATKKRAAVEEGDASAAKTKVIVATDREEAAQISSTPKDEPLHSADIANQSSSVQKPGYFDYRPVRDTTKTNDIQRGTKQDPPKATSKSFGSGVDKKPAKPASPPISSESAKKHTVAVSTPSDADFEKKVSRAASKPFNPDEKYSPKATAGGSPKAQNNYQYDPLPKDPKSKVIRVIDILPEHEAAILTLRVRTVDLADKPEYEAISYFWGPPVFDRKVVIEGQGSLYITPSLQRVLRQLRYADDVRTVWADAICINQKDIEERNAQVQLMRDVYRNSQCVTAWLGDATTISDVGLETVPRVIRALENKRQNRDPRMLRHLPDAALLKYGFPQQNSWALKCLFQIFERPWFRRVWIIQELALAPKVYMLCGDTRVQWDDFVYVTSECWGNLVTYIDSSSSAMSINVTLGRYFANTIILATKEEVNQGIKPNLVNLVARSSAAQATDARDKVFALIGLAKERGMYAGVLGAPDYALKVEVVYTNFAIENIKAYGNLDVLSLAHRPTVDDKEDNLDLPSWVPNFNNLSASDPLTRLHDIVLPSQDLKQIVIPFAATFRSVTEPSFSKENRRLCLKGHIVDVILNTGDMMHHRYESEDAIAFSQRVHNTYASWESVSGARSGKRHPPSPSSKPEDKGELLLDVYWQVINGGMPDGDFQLDYLSPMRAYHIVSVGQTIKNRDCFQIVERIAGWVQSCQDWWRIQWGDHPAEQLVVPGIANCRRVGKTKTGRMALLPGGARAGDQIALLAGSKVPYVLRKEDGEVENQVWSLIGEAYVHGIMFGEAWNDEKCHDICLD